jgi:membrane-associated protease RseP (regulator of RpoE activity)
LDRSEFESGWFPEAYHSPDSPPPKPPSYFDLERKNIILSFILLAVTFATCTLAGYGWDLQFRLAATGQVDFPAELFVNPLIVLRGIPFAVALLIILLCHELGHFLTCRQYGIYSTPPIPIPFPSFPGFLQTFGTLGAFIKIKAMFRNRRELFDVGVMGPLCGMAAAIPVFLLGMKLSTTSAYMPEGEVMFFGDSLLTFLGARMFFPDIPGESIALHPLGWAAWFGFLATSLNLLPIGQLDGGHIAYAVLGRRGHRAVSIGVFAGLIFLTVWSWPTPTYLVFALVLFFLKLSHPPTMYDEADIGRGRKWLALLMLLIFLLTFIPVPVRIEYY